MNNNVEHILYTYKDKVPAPNLSFSVGDGDPPTKAEESFRGG